MSEVAEAPAVADVSAGTLLRRAREATGLHVAALAVALKVPVRKLEALEEDRFEDMGDAVFIRGLAASVCRTLKIDPQPVLERLPQTAAPRLVRDTDGLNAPFRAPSDTVPQAWRDGLRQPVPIAVFALVAGAIVIYFLPVRQHEDNVAATAPAQTQVAANAPAPAAPSASEPAPVPTSAALTEPVVAAVPSQASATKVSAPAAASSASPAVVEAAPAAAAPASGIVVIRTKGESWVEVVDAKGVIAVRKIMAPGESAGAVGALPLQVTVGRANNTEVEVRGKPFDLRPVSRDNVARFEVK